MEKKFLAIDLGAGSGRAVLGTLRNETLELEEVHRFANEPVTLRDTLYWDLPRLFHEVLQGIRAAAQRAGGQLDGLAVDSWGVDFCLLDRAGTPLGLPVHYRDRRTEGALDAFLQVLPKEEIFAETGLQFLELNTLYQLFALKKRSPELLEAADKFLLTADLFHYLLTGRAVAEATLASTTQMWNPGQRRWSKRIVDAVGIRADLLPEIVEPGTVLCPLLDELTRSCGLRTAPPVIAAASHDTACAVAAAPADERSSWAYLSSGSWSLLGIERDGPDLSPGALAGDFTNEAGANGTITFLRNINGLWLLEECRRRWREEGRAVDHETLLGEAQRAGPAKAFILPNHADFFAPSDAPAAILDFCRTSGQEVPTTPGEVTRTILESLALTYGNAAALAAQLSGRPLERLHVVGGGSRNTLLNQLTANALGIPAVSGPVEATATGNVLLQALATGAVGSISELRAIVRRSTPLTEQAPTDRDEWLARSEAYRALEARVADGA